ncbi:MAG: hypothetical protein WCH39_04835 [Schlesneria sp.]
MKTKRSGGFQPPIGGKMPPLRAARQSRGVVCFRSPDVKLAAQVANSVNRAFEGVAYNGGLMYPTLVVGRETITGPVVVDLDSVVIPSQQRPVLDDHDDSTDGLIGRTTSLSIDQYQLNVKGVIYTKKTRAQKILSANDGGHDWQLSVGMDNFTIQRVPANQTVAVNQQTFKGPLTVLRGAYFTDLSFVAIGGDDSTWAKIAAKRSRQSKARSARASNNSKEGFFNMSFEDWMKANHPDVDLATLSAGDKESYRQQYLGTIPDDDEEEDEDEDEDLTEAEQQAALAAARRKKARLAAGRVPVRGGDGASLDRIVERATQAAINSTRLEAARIAHIQAMANGDEEGAAAAIANGMPAKDYELARLRAGRSTASGASSKPAEDEAQVMEAALLINSNFDLTRLGKYFSQEIMNRANAGRYRGFSLVECGDALIRTAGIGFNGNRKQTAHMQAVRSASSKLEAGGFTSMTLSSILENAADKVLIDAYQAVETMWQNFCAVRSLNDFKIHSQYALDPLSVFQPVGSDGDFAQLQFGDRKYSLQAGSYGVRFKIDFQTWRNDDLGSINNRIGTIGTLGASTIEQIAFALLMTGINNTAMFHASNNNYDATSASTLGIAGLTFAETLWGNQVRQNGTPLGVSPQMLMVGTALKTLSGQLFTSQKLNEVFTTAQTRTGPAPSDNPFVGRYKPVVAPQLNNSALKQNDGKTAFPHQDVGLWMLMARQGNNAPFHVGFLDGQQSPKIEVINNQSEMIGFELAAGMHFGVGFGDPKLAMAFNPNAA